MWRSLGSCYIKNTLRGHILQMIRKVSWQVHLNWDSVLNLSLSLFNNLNFKGQKPGNLLASARRRYACLLSWIVFLMDLNAKEHHKCTKESNKFGACLFVFQWKHFFPSQGHCSTGLKQQSGLLMLCNPKEAKDLLTHETHWFVDLQLGCNWWEQK